MNSNEMHDNNNFMRPTTLDFGSNIAKRKIAEDKQGRKNVDRDEHINMSNQDLPRRNKNGNKLGLRKRILLISNLAYGD